MAETLLANTFHGAFSLIHAEFLDWFDRSIETFAPHFLSPDTYGLA
jgi:hypothetical protein